MVIFQKYTNLSAVPIEAKYVFPLDDAAAVCGFEAFINGKHVVGQVRSPAGDGSVSWQTSCSSCSSSAVCETSAEQQVIHQNVQLLQDIKT